MNLIVDVFCNPVLTGNHWLGVGPTGHYRGSPGVEDHILYVAEFDDGTHLTPADFASRFANGGRS